MKLYSLRYRIAATIFVLEAIMMIIVLWLTLSSSFDETRKQIETTDQVILQNLSELGRIALLTDEYNDFQPFLEIALSDPHTVGVYLTNSDNTIYASHEMTDLGKKLPELTDTEDEYWRNIEISNAAGILGKLWIHFSNVLHETAFKHAIVYGISIAIAGMTIIAIAGLFLGVFLTRRLNELGQAAREYTRGNFAARVNIAGDEEIKDLGRTLNKMAEEIQHSLDSLKESEESFRTIFNFTSDAVFLLDPVDDRIVNVNPAACRLFEYDYNELLKVPISAIYIDRQVPIQRFFRKVFEKGSATTDDLICLSKSKKKIITSISASKINIENKKYILAQIRNITERVIFERELATSERLFRTITQSSPVAVCQTDFYGNCIYVNDVWLEQTGLTFEECLGHGWHKAIHEDDREETLRLLEKNALKEESWELEYRFRRPDGKEIALLGKVVAIRDEHNRITGYLGCNLDLTDYKLTEEALRRSQKMDAIGQLSGGIAHDFNNLLAAILGSIELLEMQATLDEKVQHRIDTIKHSAQRAVDLTKQLLGFSRKEVMRSQATDINLLINSLRLLISQSLTPEVEVVKILSEGLWMTDIDAGDFEDALINLVINARDAMEGGRGLLTIETRNVTLDENYCLYNPGVLPGEYIELAISDNGSGMSKEQQEHIFEPFYTTKEIGKGTGLGLAMVFGFVKRSKGSIKVYSEPGIGTTIRMFLPHSGRLERRVAIVDEGEKILPRGSETILVVDDEKQLLELVEESLQDQGYKVFTADNAMQALVVLEKNPDISLMISDVVMPGGINGYELAEQATALYPELKVLLTSGYTEQSMLRSGQAKFNANLLSKPYALGKLIARIKKLMNEK